MRPPTIPADLARVALGRVATLEARDGPELSITALRERGWRYLDLPRLSPDLWSGLKAGLGVEGRDYHVLIEATCGQRWARGQLMISPDALAGYRARLSAAIAAASAPRA